MKKIYIGFFVVFGFLLQLLLHAGIEIWYINLLISDFDRFGLGFSWDQWVLIHDVLGIAVLIIGIVLGYSQGKVWWQRIYEPQLEQVQEQNQKPKIQPQI